MHIETDDEAWAKVDEEMGRLGRSARREQMLRAVITGYLASYANPAATGLPSPFMIVEQSLRIADDLLAALDKADD